MNILQFHIKGIVPALMGANRLANPLDPLTIKYAQLTGTRSKTRTPQQHEEILSTQWHAALYLDDKHRICWPGENIEAMLRSAAPGVKTGLRQKLEIGMMCSGMWPLLHDGPKAIEQLYADHRFQFTRLIRNTTTKAGGTNLVRSPKFDNWEVKFELEFNDDEISEVDMVRLVKRAGSHVGLSIWRPRNGRFTLLSVRGLKDPKSLNTQPTVAGKKASSKKAAAIEEEEED